MKTTERNINCRDARREIEEAGYAEPISFAVDRHLNACRACATFYGEQLKLRQMVFSLGTVAAPNDFEFRLRARLANEKRDATQPTTLGNFSFGFRLVAFAAILFLIGSAILVSSLQQGTNESSVADVANAHNPGQPQGDTEPVAHTADGRAPAAALAANSIKSKPDDVESSPQGMNDRKRSPARATNVALANNRRLRTREMSSTAAKVIKPDDLVAAVGHSVFPIDASRRPLKVSVDNGRGASKTISVPGVSFGSQRVLAQSSSPLLASSRGSW